VGCTRVRPLRSCIKLGELMLPMYYLLHSSRNFEFWEARIGSEEMITMNELSRTQFKWLTVE
jgi:hypothetical protein